ncbi:MAG: DnaJ domain-containing protein [Actinobacteria bacterium]|nr:DnaJ domain-containing protein [Actinomycetota bacterium]
MTLNDAYRILGLATDATAAQVKAAYRRLAAEAHPDRGGRTADFIRIRAAYEILTGFLDQGPPDEEIPVPPGLRTVIDSIVNDFREQQCWAETETLVHLAGFENQMRVYIAGASRSDLRRFSETLSDTWTTTLTALFTKCNVRCDSVIQRYETWYTENTQAFFDGLYRKELLSFAWRRRFWDSFLILGAMAGALSVVIGWDGPWRRWVSLGVILVAAGLSFLLYRWRIKRSRRSRERVEPLSVTVFEMDENARFPTEVTLRRARVTTTALGLAGLFVGNAASGGLAVPVVGAVAGATLGGAVTRLLNPTARLRESMTADLRRFMEAARPQVTAYVLDAHKRLLEEVRGRIVDNYRERMKDTVGLLTAGDGNGSSHATGGSTGEDTATVAGSGRTCSPTNPSSGLATRRSGCQRRRPDLDFDDLRGKLRRVAHGARKSRAHGAREGHAMEEEAMFIVHVDVHVLSEHVERFREATVKNAACSLEEPGVARFDVAQRLDDPTCFVLVEVYRTAEGATAHKETAHYQEWRDTVAPMMAEPRCSRIYTNVFPEAEGW